MLALEHVDERERRARQRIGATTCGTSNARRAPRSRGCGGRGAGSRRPARRARARGRSPPASRARRRASTLPSAASACDVRVAASSTIQPNPSGPEVVAEAELHGGHVTGRVTEARHEQRHRPGVEAPGARPSPTRTASPPLPARASREAAGQDATREPRGLAARCLHEERRWSDAHAASHVRPGGQAPLVGKEGSERVRVLRGLIEELPDYRSGPYADIRKWLTGEIERDARPREGRPPRLDRHSPRGRRAGRARRRAERGEVVAPAGALADPDQDRRLRVHDDAAGRGDDADRRRPRPARRDPRPARRRVRGPRRRRALLGVLRNADAIVYCHAASAPPDVLATLRREVDGGRHRAARRCSQRRKVDEADDGDVDRLAAAFPELEVVPVSVLDDASLERFREAVWRLTRLLRVYLRHAGVDRRRAARASLRERRSRTSPTRSTTSWRRRSTGARLGHVRALRRAAGRPRPRGRRRRRGRDLAREVSSASRSSTVSRRRMSRASPSRTSTAAGRPTPL